MAAEFLTKNTKDIVDVDHFNQRGNRLLYIYTNQNEKKYFWNCYKKGFFYSFIY